VCCSVLQCVAVWWIGFVPVILQRDNRAHRIVSPLAKIHQSGAEWFSVLQRVAVCCSVVQRVAAWCSMVQCGAVWCSVVQCGAVWCSVLQCVQCVAVCCSVLQCGRASNPLTSPSV